MLLPSVGIANSFSVENCCGLLLSGNTRLEFIETFNFYSTSKKAKQVRMVKTCRFNHRKGEISNKFQEGNFQKGTEELLIL